MSELKGNMSKYLEGKIIDHVLRGTNYTAPSTIYVGLITDSATGAELEAGTLTNEVTTYTGNRKAVTWSTKTVVDGATRVVNTNEITFSDMPACTLEYLVLVDLATGGNILWWTKMPTKKIVNTGDIVTIQIATLIVNID